MNPRPISGYTQYPLVDFLSSNNPAMDTETGIAQNLARLMESHPGRDTLQKVAKASGVGFGTVQRARNGDGNLTVANLDRIAAAFHRTARDLLACAASDEPYAPAPQGPAFMVQEAPADEVTLLLGYRAASPEVREIMLDLALKASRKKPVSPPNHHSG